MCCLLSKEFGFQGLDEKIVEAKKEGEAVKDVGLLNRLRRIEKTLELIQGDNRRLSKLEPCVTALERFIASVPADVAERLKKVESKTSHLDKDISNERKSRRRDVTAIEERVASVPADFTGQITAERNERIADVRDMNAAVQDQAAKLDGTVAAKLDQIAAQISDERNSRQSDIQDLKARIQQAPPSASTQTPKVTPAPTSGARTDFKLAGNKFDGVIKHLTRISGGNPADSRLVNATGSSNDKYKLSNALDLYNKENVYCSCYSPNQWLCLDFKVRQVSVTHYSLCSNLVFWVVEGSHDGSAWDQLDKRGDEDMKESPKGANEVSFAVAKLGQYRFIRIRQTGQNSVGNDNLLLRKIELFGTLIE